MPSPHVVVSLLSAMAAAFAPEEHVKMMPLAPMVAAVAPDGNVKMIRRAVTVTPNAEIAIADEVEKQFIDEEQVDVDEGNKDKADAYTKAHDAVEIELKLKEAELTEFKRVKVQVTANLAAKTKELKTHQGTYCSGIWDCGWQQVKRFAKNVWKNTENRLKREENGLKLQATGSSKDVSRLRKEVGKLRKMKTDHAALKGLKQAHALVDKDIASDVVSKKAAQKSHAKIEQDKQAEHKAKEVLHTGIIDSLQDSIHSKRDELYNLTATCARYKKKETKTCEKCSSRDGKRACGGKCIANTTKCDKDPGCACNKDVAAHTLHQEFATANKSLQDTINKTSMTIVAASRELTQADEDEKKLTTDKATADALYDSDKKKILDLKAALEKQRTLASASKVQAEKALKQATKESEATVAALEKELAKQLIDMKRNHAKEKGSRTKLLLAQQAVFDELLIDHGTVIAGWDSKLAEHGGEKERLLKAIKDLKAVIDKH